MQSIKVEELMVPLAEYATVSQEATLGDAVCALETAQKSVYGWVGPIFWPYAYYDLYDYTWWGWGYDPYFWDYGYGDLYAGLFGPYDYDALSGYAYYLPGYAGRPPASGRSRATGQTTTLADMCGSDRSDIAGFPIEQFRSAIQPNAEQSTRSTSSPARRRRRPRPYSIHAPRTCR